MGQHEERTGPLDQSYQLLNLFYTNCRSAKGKSTELSALTLNQDIICLTETHLDVTVSSRTIINRDDLVFFRKDRNINGGGVLIGVNNLLHPKELKLDSCEAEALFVQVDGCITICCYYRPHQSIDITNFAESFHQIANMYPKDHLILLGDLNFPGFDWVENTIKPDTAYKNMHIKFHSFLCENNLTQLIETPTHVRGNTLDLVCTNNITSVSTSVISPGISDHFIIKAEIRHCHQQTEPHTRPRKLYHKADVDKFQDLLWPTQLKLTEMTDANEMWDLFSKELKKAVDESVPTLAAKHRPSKQPFWFNKKANKLVAKHRKTYNKFKQTNDPFFLNKYKQERRKHKAELREIEQEYIANRICKPLETGNSKPFYHHLKRAQGVTKPPMKLISKNDSHTENPIECANILNEFFSSQFCKQHVLDATDYSAGSSNQIEVSIGGVYKLLKSLKNGKSPGPDEIRKEDLTIDPNMTAKCLTTIFQASLSTSRLPTEWKLAHVTPLHKRGATDQPNNYRPISLTSISCKMLEHIVLHHLNVILDKVLYNRQHGFRKGLSCETQLCGTYHEIAKHIDKGNTVHALVLDFAKAFDKVPHKLLMQKISRLPDISSNILMWIHDFLLNRKQKVMIKGMLSEELPVTSGVPLGSVLGPILFLIYINDLPKVVNCSTSLFADDTLLYQPVNNDEEKKLFQTNIYSLQNWAQTWCMSFNIDKCSVLVFNPTQSSPQAEYKLNDTALAVVQETKYLGVVLQSNLKFNNHIQSKVLKAKRQLGMLKRALHAAPEKARLLAYTSLCRPHIEYAAAVWDTSLEYLKHDIEMVQHNAIRFICQLKGRESITEARNNLQLDTLADRRTKIRHALLMRILSKEENHESLSSSYDELMSVKPDNIPNTRAATRGDPPTIYAKTSAYHNSFLPKTVRELKSKLTNHS